MLGDTHRVPVFWVPGAFDAPFRGNAAFAPWMSIVKLLSSELQCIWKSGIMQAGKMLGVPDWPWQVPPIASFNGYGKFGSGLCTLCQ